MDSKSKSQAQVPAKPKCFWCREVLEDKAYEYREQIFCTKGCAHEFSERPWLVVSQGEPVIEKQRITGINQLRLSLVGKLGTPCVS